VWTVNDAEDMRRLIGWGVDAIITDRPDVAVGIVREGQQPS
jgi:glycerophosphoryl diester phosphodiesterase